MSRQRCSLATCHSNWNILYFSNLLLSLSLIVSPGNSMPCHQYCKRIRHQGRYLNWIYSRCICYSFFLNADIVSPVTSICRFHFASTKPRVQLNTICGSASLISTRANSNTWYASATMFILWFVFKYLIFFHFRCVFPFRNNFFVFFFAFSVVLRLKSRNRGRKAKCI